MTHKAQRSKNLTTLALIWSLAWPTMAEQVMQTAVQYIDTAMVGSLGTDAGAAVGSTTTIGWLIFSTISAFGIGFLSYIARACGADDVKSAKRFSAQAVFTVLVLGTLFTVATLSLSPYIPIWMKVDASIQKTASTYFFILYTPMLARTASSIFGTVLRAAGDTKTPMKVGIVVNIINVILNFVLIYGTRSIFIFGKEIPILGFGLGVIGAALASAIAYFIGGILITYFFLRHKKISPIGERIRPDMSLLGPCLKISIPNMLQRFGTSFGYVAFAAMINSIGPVATAAHSFANTVESAFYIPGFGMQTAASTLTGNAYGARDNEKMKSISTMFIPLEICLMLCSGLALFFSAPYLMDIFSNDPNVINLGATVLKMVAVSEPLYGFSIIVEGMLMGVGKTKLPFIYNIIGMWGVRIVFTFICTQIFSLGLIVAWGCMIAHNILLFFMFLVTYVRGNWNPLKNEAQQNSHNLLTNESFV